MDEEVRLVMKGVSKDGVMYAAIGALLLVAFLFMAFFSTLHISAKGSADGMLEIADVFPGYDYQNGSLNVSSIDIEFEVDIPVILLWQVQGNPFSSMPGW